MIDDDDTKVFEYKKMVEAEKKILNTRLFPFRIAIACVVAMLLLIGTMLAIRYAKRKPGVVTTTHGIPSPVKSNHVIFRLGDEEIFRFVYENGGDGRRYSFEVREGDS